MNPPVALSLIASFFSGLLEMDHIGVRTEDGKTVYIFKTTSIFPSLVEMKSKILSVLDAPVDIPEDIRVKEVKRGLLTKEYVVEIVVSRDTVGKLSNLIAKKYGLIRSRPYR